MQTVAETHAEHSRKIGSLLSRCGLRYSNGREWERMSDILEDPRLRSPSNGFNPALFLKLLDGGLIQTLTSILQDARVRFVRGDVTSGGPPTARKKTLGTLWMWVEGCLSCICMYLYNSRYSSSLNAERYDAPLMDAALVYLSSAQRQPLLFEPDNHPLVVDKRRSTVKALLSLLFPDDRPPRVPQTAICECTSIASRIWSTTDWIPSAPESTGLLVAQCFELLVPCISSLPADFAKQQSLEQLTGLSVERVCTLYLQCASQESLSGPIREICLIFIVQLGDSGYRTDVVSTIKSRGLYTPQVEGARNIIAQLVGDPESDQFRSASLRYWTAFFNGDVETKLAEKAINDGIVSCLGDWSIPSPSDDMGLLEAKANAVTASRIITSLSQSLGSGSAPTRRTLITQVHDAVQRAHRNPRHRLIAIVWDGIHSVVIGEDLLMCTLPGCGAITSPDGGDLLQCSRCKSTYYCSTKCQRSDWKRHKPNCAPPTISAPKKTLAHELEEDELD